MKTFPREDSGFSTLEIMIALTILTIVLSGVVVADFGAQYWTITAQTSNEALYKAKMRLEGLKSASKQNFFDATSSPLAADVDASCATGGLCYFVQNLVTDISSCSKYATAAVSWQVGGYPKTNTSLFTYLTNPAEAVAQGGDCLLNWPQGTWTHPDTLYAKTLRGNPTSVDVFGGVAYMTMSQSPYLAVRQANDVDGPNLFQNSFQSAIAFNGLDVVRDLATGRTYAYLAAADAVTQLHVVDVTDSNNPLLVARSALLGVTTTSGAPNGWRVRYYGQKVYLTTLFNVAPGGEQPELHVFDVSRPTAPFEVGRETLSTSVYDIAVRDQVLPVDGKTHRLAYLATTNQAGELRVLDVTDPKNISTLATCDLPGNYPARAVYLLGNVLYVGRDNVPSGGADLYSFDAQNPSATSFCTPTGQVDINTSDGYSRKVLSIRASGPLLFVATTNTTGAHGTVQIRPTDPITNFSPVVGTVDVPGLVAGGIDLDGNYLYTASQGSAQQLQVIESPN